MPPLMVQTDANPGGLPKSVFDGLQAELAANRSVFYRALPSGPFYGFNRPGVEPSEAIIENWWRQGMMGGAKAHYDGIVAFSQTDFTEDLKKITVPVLVMHGEDDQIVPYADSGPLSAKLVQNGTLKTYKGFPHGMPTTQAPTINADLLAFLQSDREITKPATHILESTPASVSPGVLDPSRPAALTIEAGDIVSYPNTWTQWGNQAKFGMSFADREPLRRKFPFGPVLEPRSGGGPWRRAR